MEVSFNYVFIDTQGQQRKLSYKERIDAYVDFASSGTNLELQFTIGHFLAKRMSEVEQRVRTKCVQCDRPTLRMATLWTPEYPGNEIYYWILPVCGVEHYDSATLQLGIVHKPTFNSHRAAAPMCYASGPGHQG